MFILRPLPAFEDNYIWTLSIPDGRALIVDPGDARPVLQAIDAGLVPVAILLTHHHNDHIGGVAELLARHPTPCYAPNDPRIVHASQRVGDGDHLRIEALDLDLEVLAVPGHTSSHIAYLGAGHLFCGDTLFSLGCGRLFEGTPAQMLASLDRLAALPAQTLVCCAHEYTQGNGRFAEAAEPGNTSRDDRLAEVARLRRQGQPSLPSTIASERDCNPFLRIDQPALMQVLQSRAAQPLDRIAAFAALRAWKDGFRA